MNFEWKNEKTKTGEDCANQCPVGSIFNFGSCDGGPRSGFCFCYVNGKVRKYKNRGLYSFQFHFVEPNVVSHNELLTQAVYACPSGSSSSSKASKTTSKVTLVWVSGSTCKSRSHVGHASVGICEVRCPVILTMHVLLYSGGKTGTT